MLTIKELQQGDTFKQCMLGLETDIKALKAKEILSADEKQILKLLEGTRVLLKEIYQLINKKRWWQI